MRALYPLVKRFGASSSIQSTELAKSMFLVGIHGHSNEILENKDILQVLKSSTSH